MVIWNMHLKCWQNNDNASGKEWKKSICIQKQKQKVERGSTHTHTHAYTETDKTQQKFWNCEKMCALLLLKPLPTLLAAAAAPSASGWWCWWSSSFVLYKNKTYCKWQLKSWILHFRALCCKICVQICFCVCVCLGPLSPLPAAYRFKNKKNQEQRHMLHVCVLVCVYFRVYVLCGRCVTPTSTPTMFCCLRLDLWHLTFTRFLVGASCHNYACVCVSCICVFMFMCVPICLRVCPVCVFECGSLLEVEGCILLKLVKI